MNISRCENGHFYDKDKFENCPHCSASYGKLSERDPIVEAYNPLDNEWGFIAKIGEGAFGKVYKLVSKKNGNFSALKVISICAEDVSELYNVKWKFLYKRRIGQYVKRKIAEVINEVKLMYKLNNCKNIVKIKKHFVYKRKNEMIWDVLIQMEMLTSIDIYFKKNLYSEQDILKLAMDICSALVYCEQFNIIHGDIKPQNIFVDNEGVFKLGDFGSATLLNDTRIKQYTLYYCAPELYEGQGVADYSTDIYSLGMVLYEYLNENRLPFVPKGSITKEILQQAQNFRKQGHMFPSPILANEPFAKIILKACAYNKNDRYQNASELLADLRKVESLGKEYLNDTLDLDTMFDVEKEIPPIFDTLNIYEGPTEEIGFESSPVPSNPMWNKFLKLDTQGRISDNFSSRIINRMINWIGFTCIFALMPLFIYVLLNMLFGINISLDEKLITDFFYFGLTLSVVIIREMFSFQLWKKEKNIYLMVLFIILIVLILSAVFFGAMTLCEMDVLKVKIDNKHLLVASLILGISSFITGCFVQIWEEM